jgi:antitoxin VapB
MPLSIKDPEADRLARAVAARTGETLTQAVITALRERLAREERRTEDADTLVDEVLEIGRHCAALPVRDPRPPDALLGYDERGLPR